MTETNFQIESASVSDRGLSDKRPQNEDSYLELPDKGIFAVADGVGGAQAGDVASQMAVEILGEAFINQNAPADAEDVMRLAIERANEAIFQMAMDLPQLSSMATTIVALHVDGNIATIGHVGDSRLYRLSPDGSLNRETQDHSVVEEEVRAGRMTPEQAVNHPSKNVISRALGAESTVEIDLRTIMTAPGSRFLLCSDGITRHIDDAELEQILSDDASPSSICSHLKEICYERGAEDNLTAVIVDIASNASAANAPSAAETDIETEEEATVATVRSPFDSIADENAGLEEPLLPGEPAAGERDDATDEQFLMVDTDEVAENDETAEEIGPVSKNDTFPATDAVSAKETSPQHTEHDEPQGSGIAAKALTAIAMLVLGAAIGAAGYGYWSRPNEEVIPAPQPAPITEMKSNNTPLTAFEEGRRLVDSDPQKYLDANAAKPDVAEDHFLLGRAYMLTGRYWEAKRAFNEAKGKLAQADPANSRTLAAEIAMALSIIESPSATEMFSRDIKTANPIPVDANSSTNNLPAATR